MPNGTDGWIKDKLSQSDGSIQEALLHEAFEADSNKQKAKDKQDDFDDPIRRQTDDWYSIAGDYFNEGDIALNALLAELGGNYVDPMLRIREQEQEEFLARMRAGNTTYREPDFDLEGFLDGLFGGLDDSLDNFDFAMPSINLQGFEALALLPSLLLGFKVDLANWFKFDIKEYQDTLAAMEAATKRPEMG